MITRYKMILKAYIWAIIIGTMWLVYGIFTSTFFEVLAFEVTIVFIGLLIYTPIKVKKMINEKLNHQCINCDKFISFRGFCCKDCHNEYYDRWDLSKDNKTHEK